jgi:hypothetical protein
MRSSGAIRASIVVALALATLPVRAAAGSRLAWHGSGVWLSGDIHVHNLLDRKKREAIIDAAAEAGVDFIASTEHADHIFHREPKKRHEFLRARQPELIVLAGIEWYVPGAGHASVVAPQAADEWRLLKRFAKRFDRVFGSRNGSMPVEGGEDEANEHGTWGKLEGAEAGLAWLRLRARPGEPRPVVYLNHPSRGRLVTDQEIADLQAAGLDGIEIGPGHQLRDPPGTDDTLDRYEPYAAVVGGGYDQLLARGRNLGLSAGSDFHRSESAYPPGVFSRTLVYAPERSAAGVLRGLASGATVTVMGGLVRSAWTETSYAGSDDPALIGEVLEVPPRTSVTYRLRLEVPELDFAGQPNRIDRLEVISNCLGPPAVVQTFEPQGTGPMTFEYRFLPQVGGGSCYLRARGRRILGGSGNSQADADLLFYTGGTRLLLGP